MPAARTKAPPKIVTADTPECRLMAEVEAAYYSRQFEIDGLLSTMDETAALYQWRLDSVREAQRRLRENPHDAPSFGRSTSWSTADTVARDATFMASNVRIDMLYSHAANHARIMDTLDQMHSRLAIMVGPEVYAAFMSYLAAGPLARMAEQQRRKGEDRTNPLVEPRDFMSGDERAFVVRCVNTYGDTDHPKFDVTDLNKLRRKYAARCVRRALHSGELTSEELDMVMTTMRVLEP